MAHSVRRHLRVDVDAYDAIIRDFIPRYEEMLSQAAAQVAATAPGVVLDLGAGTGGLSAALLELGTKHQIHLYDIDLEMLDAARSRLGTDNPRVAFHSRSFNDPFPPCVGIMASLSLHHIPRLEDKLALYERALHALEPGGVFVNADATVAAESPARDRDYAAWARHMAERGISRDQAYANFDEWAEEDTYFSLDQEIAALTQAGFRAECVWRETPSTVLVGHAP